MTEHRSKKKHKASKIPVDYFRPDKIEEFARTRIIDDFRIDQSVFKKTLEERLRLKTLKANLKQSK